METEAIPELQRNPSMDDKIKQTHHQQRGILPTGRDNKPIGDEIPTRDTHHELQEYSPEQWNCRPQIRGAALTAKPPSGKKRSYQQLDNESSEDEFRRKQQRDQREKWIQRTRYDWNYQPLARPLICQRHTHERRSSIDLGRRRIQTKFDFLDSL